MRRGKYIWLAGPLILFGLATALWAADSARLPGALTSAIQQGRVRTIDLTYSLDERSPFWPEGSPVSPFHAAIAATYEHDGYYARSLQLPEHIGTHMDAPCTLIQRARVWMKSPYRIYCWAPQWWTCARQ